MNLSALKLSVIPHSFNPTSEEPALLFVAIIYRCSLNASKTCNHEATVCKDDWTHSLIKTWMCRMAAAFSKTAHPTNVWVIKVTLRNPKPKIKQIAREMLIVRLFFSFLYENQLESIRLTKTDVSECRHNDSQTNIVSAMNVEVCGVHKYLNMD